MSGNLLGADEHVLRIIRWDRVLQDQAADLGFRAVTAAFDAPNHENVSVYGVSLLAANQVAEESVLDGLMGDSLVELKVGDIIALDLGLTVVHAPDNEDEHPRGLAHCEIVGLPTANSARKRVRQALASLARWHTLNPPDLL